MHGGQPLRHVDDIVVSLITLSGSFLDGRIEELGEVCGLEAIVFDLFMLFLDQPLPALLDQSLT